MKRKIQLTLETAETFVVQTPRSIQRHYCPVCRTLVDMVSPYVLATISGESERKIFRLIEQAVFHFVEADRLFICLNSINEIKGDIKQ